MEKKDGQGFGCLAALLLALALLIGIGWVSYVREERELRQKSCEEFPNNTPRICTTPEEDRFPRGHT